MTTEDLLTYEAITVNFPTWTFDPSVLTPGEGDDDMLYFPAEVEELFAEVGCAIVACEMELFEETVIDEKNAFISIGVVPVAFMLSEEDYDLLEEGEVTDINDYDMVTPGSKVFFMPGDAIGVQRDKEYIIRFPKTEG